MHDPYLRLRGPTAGYLHQELEQSCAAPPARRREVFAWSCELPESKDTPRQTKQALSPGNRSQKMASIHKAIRATYVGYVHFPAASQSSDYSTALLQDPLIVLVLDRDWPLLVETDAPSVEDGSGQDRVRDCRETVTVVIGGLCQPRIHATRGINEFLDGNIAISALAVKVSALRGGVLHAAGESNSALPPTSTKDVLEGVVPGLPGLVINDVITAMCLVHVNLALEHQDRLVVCNPSLKSKTRAHLFCHIVPVLCGMYAGL